uniref:Uncharacterized protein n=1 Tax=Ciona savignyi TaxID=51511 RepID=H2YS11_CIOSA
TTSLCQRRNGESSKDHAGQETRSRRFFQRKSKKDYPPRVSIEPSSAGTRPSLRSNDSVFEGTHEPLNNAANAYPNPEYSNLHIVENLTRTGQDSEGESAWSEDHFESDNPSSSQLTSPTTNQATLNSQYNMNNNRAIGVAHMMNRKSSGRISQVVRPTFISKYYYFYI